MNVTVIRRFIIFLFLLLAKSEAVVPVTIDLPPRYSNPILLGTTTTHLYFLSKAPDDGSEADPHLTLWITDGTQTGTRQLADIGVCAPTGKVQAGENCIYFSTLPTYSGGLWLTSDSSETTTIYRADSTGVTALDPATLFSDRRDYPTGNATLLGIHGDSLYMEIPGRAGIPQLWMTDGTRTGTILLDRLSYITSSISTPDHFYYTSSTLYRTSTVRVTDGTLEGTHTIEDAQGTGSLLGAQGNLTYFTAGSENKLWSTDGTAAGTHSLIALGSIPVINRLSPIYSDATAFHHGRFYLVDRIDSGNRLWSSDGTLAGTSLVTGDLPASYVSSLYASSAGIWMTSAETGRNTTLRLSDGTASGTRIMTTLEDLDAIEGGSTRPLAVAGDSAYYISSTGPVSISAADGSRRLLTTFRNEWLTSSFIKFKGTDWFATSRRLWMIPPANPAPEQPPTCGLSITPGKKAGTVTLLTSTVMTKPGSPEEFLSTTGIKTWIEIWSTDTPSYNGSPRFIKQIEYHDIGAMSSVGIVGESTLSHLLPGRHYLIRTAAQNPDHISYSDFVSYSTAANPALINDIQIQGITSTWSESIPLDFTTQDYQVTAADTSIRITGWKDTTAENAKLPVFINGKVFNKKSPTYTFKLKPGKNTFKITSYSSGYKKKQTYTLTLIRPKAS
jgi:Cadherin-like beta sandwich domain